MYSEPGASYSLKVDEDLKTLGIGNDTPAFFETSISLLGDPQKSEIANRVLLRYTGMEKSQAEWERWYSTLKDKLFFTEAAGYNWMVDTTK
ncbi:hypothetical protein SAMN02927921_00471 [Sinomicrobium oceani]|uniref:Uncharacterized protein n=1 Tax=Sinomicrobium oceani TaxID=1150368 RepID=A0A1K1M8J2_9FLAO|nr:hypothetical protein [Sinomicrobium oceani]SFW19393.1 hypothetical protein SAMN02927921_00471 [Sinomicrobium oceani]